MLLVTGAAGAGLVLLALRQDWARVTVAVPRPLPASTVALTGQDLVPAAAALAVAALASLAAVLATRRLLRRVTGLITAGLGIGITLLAAGRLTAADVLAAAQAGTAPATGSGAGTAAGSVTAGSTAGGDGTGGALTGFPAHAVLAATGWRGLMISAALVIIAAGFLVALRASRLPVMSSRYDRSPGRASSARRRGAGPDSARGTGRARSARPATAATMWESLTAGDDPTAGPGRDSG